MIVRIMGEGQLTLGDEHVDVLNSLDAELESAVEGGDQEAFTRRCPPARQVRALGNPLPDDTLAPSDAVLPPPTRPGRGTGDARGDEGLIPG